MVTALSKVGTGVECSQPRGQAGHDMYAPFICKYALSRLRNSDRLSAMKHRRTTVGRNRQLQTAWEQTGFDFLIGQCRELDMYILLLLHSAVSTHRVRLC